MASEKQQVTVEECTKRPYSEPKIEEYGSLASLTAGTGGNATDSPVAGSHPS
jgi:hypothetical protein